MKQTAKRLLSMALAFVMVLSLLPAMSVTALADEEGEDDSTTKDAFGISMSDWTQEEKEQQFYVILERLVKEISLTRNREARYRRLDEAIRRQQESRRMTAASQEKSEHAKRK